MKKILFFLLTAVVLLSFTVVSNSNSDIKKSPDKSPVESTEGFALEDRNQWD